nr:hypothetical protein [Tanacetum cinerariifolium]
MSRIIPHISLPFGANSSNPGSPNINRVDTMPTTTDPINTTTTTNVSRSVVDKNLPKLLDSRGGSHVTNVPAFDKKEFTSWKVSKKGKKEKEKSEKGLLAELFDWDDKSISLDNEGSTKIRAFMAIVEDEPSVGKVGARSGQWVNITMKKDEIIDLKKVIEKWTYSKVTLDQLLSGQVHGNIIKALGRKGRRKEKISSKEVVFTKANESSPMLAHEITFDSESECDFQKPLLPLPKLIGATPSSTSDNLISLSDLTLNIDDLTLETHVPKKTRPSVKMSPAHVVKKRTEKSPVIPKPYPDKKTDSSTEQLIFTLIKEVNGLKRYSKESGPKVAFGDDSLGDTEGYGSVNCNGITFTRVAYVNGLKHNLINITCKKGKHHRASFKTKRSFSINKSLHFLHMDLFRSIKPQTIRHNKYTLAILDEYSRKMKNLNEVRVREMISDNKTEFKNHKLEEFCDEKGISQNFSSPYTPKQNGVAKRRNITLIEAARTMTSYDVFIGTSPDISYFYVFGCPVHIHNHKDHLRKFNKKANDEFFLGYSPVAKAFRVFNIKRKEMEEIVHVTFSKDDESISQSSTEGDAINFNKNISFLDDEFFEQGVKLLSVLAILKLNQLKRKKVRTLVPKPHGKTIIGTKWSWKNKMDKNGILIKNQQEGINYEEPFALVVRLEAIKIFLAYAAYMGFMMYQIDVMCAFLRVSVNETLFRGMIGSLMYLTTSRPDIQFSICLCARYQANLNESHLVAVKRTFSKNMEITVLERALTLQPIAIYVEYLKEFGYTTKVEEETKTITFLLSWWDKPLSFTKDEFISAIGLPIYRDAIPLPPKETIRAGLATLGLFNKDKPTLSSIVLSLIPPSKEVNADDTVDKSLSRASVQPVTQSKAPTDLKTTKKRIPPSSKPKSPNKVKPLSWKKGKETILQPLKLKRFIAMEEVAVDQYLEILTVEQLLDEADKLNKAIQDTPESPYDTESEINVVKSFLTSNFSKLQYVSDSDLQSMLDDDLRSVSGFEDADSNDTYENEDMESSIVHQISAEINSSLPAIVTTTLKEQMREELPHVEAQKELSKSLQTNIRTSIKLKVRKGMKEVLDKLSVCTSTMAFKISGLCLRTEAAEVFKKANAKGDKWEKNNPETPKDTDVQGK